MIRTADGPLNFIRLGLSRKKDFLCDTRKAYDGLMVPANILLYQYKSTPSIIFKTKQVFAVDPMSYLFGQPYEAFKKRVKDTDGYEFKPSFRKLMDGHGLPVEDFVKVSYEKLIRFLLDNSAERELFVEKALGFQRNKVRDVLKKAEEEMNENYINDKTKSPQFLIPPYFLWDDGQNFIHNLNFDIARFACGLNIAPAVYPMIFVEKAHLKDRDFLDRIQKWILLKPQGFCLWVNDFKESDADENEIEGLVELVKLLSGEKERDVFMLFGGYFSLLLYHFGLSAISHGTSFSESRRVKASVQKSSGPAPVRYYIRDLHRFFSLDDAIRILKKRDDLMCECIVCRQVIKGNPENIAKFQSEREELVEIHFLHNRYYEKRDVGKVAIQDLSDYLRFTYENNLDLESLEKENSAEIQKGFVRRPIVDLGYLKKWSNVLGKLVT